MTSSALELSECRERVLPRQLQALLNRGAFWAQNRSLEDLAVALAHSEPIVSLWDGETLVGFGRATSDGVYRAVLWDIVVDPDYQGRGWGRKLVTKLLEHPRLRRVERIYLMTTYQQSFYERLGFSPDTGTTTLYLSPPPPRP